MDGEARQIARDAEALAARLERSAGVITAYDGMLLARLIERLARANQRKER